MDLHNYHLRWGGEVPAHCPAENDPSDPTDTFGDYVWLYLPDMGTMASAQVNGDGFLKINRSMDISAASDLAGIEMATRVVNETKQWGALVPLSIVLGRVFLDLAKQGGATQ